MINRKIVLFIYLITTFSWFLIFAISGGLFNLFLGIIGLYVYCILYDQLINFNEKVNTMLVVATGLTTTSLLINIYLVLRTLG